MDAAGLHGCSGLAHTIRMRDHRDGRDAGDLVAACQQHYDRLAPNLQAEIPLKRVWTLVLAE